jgi:recombination protein RecA
MVKSKTKKNNDLITKSFEEIDGEQQEEYYEEVYDLMDDTIRTIQSQYKGSDAMKIDTLEAMYSDLMPAGYITTGDDRLDLIISNRPKSGTPLSKFINLFGDSSSGKSLLASCIAAEFQKRGGYVLWFDTERAAFPPFMEVLGVQKKKTIFVPETRSIEKIFQIILKTVVNNNKRNSKAPLLIVIDSMTSTNIEEVVENLDEMNAGGYNSGAQKQKMLSGAFPKILDHIKDENVSFLTIDQLRDNMDRANPFSPRKRDTSGNSQRFYSDIRIEMVTRKIIKNKKKEQIGQIVRVTTKKNRIAPSPREAEIYLYSTRGLDRFASWIDELKNQKKITQYKGKFTYTLPDAEEPVLYEGDKPTEAQFKKMLRLNKEFKEKVYNDWYGKYIFSYERRGDDYLDDIQDEVILEDPEDEDGNKKEQPTFIKKRTDNSDEEE